LSVRRELAGSLAFLYYQRRNLLDGDEEHWTRIGGCERRLLEHIDAIVAGGARMAWSVASGVLDGEPGLAFGGAMVLATIGSEAAFGCLLEVIGQIDEAALPAVADALRHAPGSAALTAALEQMRRAERPAVAAMALDVQSYRRDLPAAIVLPLLAGSDPVLRRAAIVAAIRGGSSAHAEPVLRAVRELEAHELGLPGLLRLDRGLALSVAREHSNPGDPAFGVALLTRAVAADTTVTGLLREGVRSPAVATAALDAVGALGDVGFVPLLLQALASEAASAAASALRRITGADLREEADVADPDDPEAAVRVERISQDPAVWTRWWQDHGERMAASHRHRFGLRYGATAIAAELEARGRLSERNRACFELELALDKPVLAADWFVARQHAFLGDLAGRRATR
ncbi:MAG: hypothetical protein KDE27_23330, partial [Planctomycetes bacterium]|nr:hypothetical protein [Planctomycetota bacterium]